MTPIELPPPAPGVDAAALLGRVTNLPPLPEALTAVLQALAQEALSASRSIGLIERDQALAASTLRLANSAFYGAPGRVGSIADAVRMLGLRTVAGVLTAASVHRGIQVTHCPGFSYPHYWRHAVTTALVARAFAPAARQDPDEAFLAGLLHDVGLLVLAAFCPQQAQQAIELALTQGLDAEQAEQAVLGIDHGQIGALVTQRWHFPPAIVQAIADHHPASAAVPAGAWTLAQLVRAADRLAGCVGAPGGPGGPGGVASAPSPALWAALGLGAETGAQWLATARDNAQQLADSLLGG